MNVGTLSALSSRKRELNQLCSQAVAQQISQHKVDNTQHRQRRRYLAKQVQKRLPLTAQLSSQRWLHAVTIVLAMWGFNDLVMPNQAQAATQFVSPPATWAVYGNATPSFVDIDADGDLDAFVGDDSGTSSCCKATGLKM